MTYGHIHKMAEAIAEGVKAVEGAEAVSRRVPETLCTMGLSLSDCPIPSRDRCASMKSRGGTQWRIDHRRRFGEKMPSENELDAARFQGRHVAEITSKLTG